MPCCGERHNLTVEWAQIVIGAVAAIATLIAVKYAADAAASSEMSVRVAAETADVQRETVRLLGDSLAVERRVLDERTRRENLAALERVALAVVEVGDAARRVHEQHQPLYLFVHPVNKLQALLMFVPDDLPKTRALATLGIPNAALALRDYMAAFHEVESAAKAVGAQDAASGL